jgi:hypothetical protein
MIKQSPLLLERNWLWEWLRIRASFAFAESLVACGNKSDKILSAAEQPTPGVTFDEC